MPEGLKRQIELLQNNLNTFDIPLTHIKSVKTELAYLSEEFIPKLEQDLEYAIKGISLVKEGFDEIQKNLDKINKHVL